MRVTTATLMLADALLQAGVLPESLEVTLETPAFNTLRRAVVMELTPLELRDRVDSFEFGGFTFRRRIWPDVMVETKSDGIASS